jgi:hypothetical protein
MLRNEDHVHVVGHQHPASDGDALGGAMLGQKVASGGIVFIIKEVLLTPIAALRHMVWHAGGDKPCQPGHGHPAVEMFHVI